VVSRVLSSEREALDFAAGFDDRLAQRAWLFKRKWLEQAIRRSALAAFAGRCGPRAVLGNRRAWQQRGCPHNVGVGRQSLAFGLDAGTGEHMELGRLAELLELLGTEGEGVYLRAVRKGSTVRASGIEQFYDFDGWEIGYMRAGVGGELAVGRTIEEAVDAALVRYAGDG